jgi:glycerophosphoryl diester phosphodiesterase
VWQEEEELEAAEEAQWEEAKTTYQRTKTIFSSFLDQDLRTLQPLW